MKFPKISAIFFAAIAIIFVFPSNVFAKNVSAEIRFVLLSPEIIQSEIFVKSGGIFKKINGAPFAFPKAILSYAGENPIERFEKNSAGEYVKVSELFVPENAQKCLAVIVSAGRSESEKEPDFTEKFSAFAIDFPEKNFAAGTLNLLNFSNLPLRARVVESAAVTIPAKSSEKIFTFPKGEKSISAELRIVAAAKSQEAAQRAWRYGNSMSLVEKRKYFLLVVPAKKREGRPPQCEVFSLHAE